MIIQHFIENKIENIECINSSNKLKNFIEKRKLHIMKEKNLVLNTLEKYLK